MHCRTLPIPHADPWDCLFKRSRHYTCLGLITEAHQPVTLGPPFTTTTCSGPSPTPKPARASFTALCICSISLYCALCVIEHYHCPFLQQLHYSSYQHSLVGPLAIHPSDHHHLEPTQAKGTAASHCMYPLYGGKYFSIDRVVPLLIFHLLRITTISFPFLALFYDISLPFSVPSQSQSQVLLLSQLPKPTAQISLSKNNVTGKTAAVTIRNRGKVHTHTPSPTHSHPARFPLRGLHCTALYCTEPRSPLKSFHCCYNL